MQHQYNKSFRVSTYTLWLVQMQRKHMIRPPLFYTRLIGISAPNRWLSEWQSVSQVRLKAITAPDYMIQPEFSVQKFSFPTSGITVRKSPCSVGHERLMQWNNMMKSWKLKYKWCRAIIRRLSSELSSTILLPLAGPDHIKWSEQPKHQSWLLPSIGTPGVPMRIPLQKHPYYRRSYVKKLESRWSEWLNKQTTKTKGALSQSTPSQFQI